jgi:hypothetical protein
MQMQVKRGQSRIVFIFPLLRIVFKFPIIHPFVAVRPFFRRDIKGKKWKYLKMYLSWPLEVYGSFRGLLFRGLSANWNEFLFYWKTRNQFLQPTYFSLFGFLNIQRYDKPCQLHEVDLWCQLHELTEGHVHEDGHVFANPHNFCFSGGAHCECLITAAIAVRALSSNTVQKSLNSLTRPIVGKKKKRSSKKRSRSRYCGGIQGFGCLPCFFSNLSIYAKI